MRVTRVDLARVHVPMRPDTVNSPEYDTAGLAS